MSAFIEAAQYFMMRNSAVDDVILNTAGAMVGFAIYKILSKKCSSFTDSFCAVKYKSANGKYSK